MEVSGEFRVHCSWCDLCSGFGNARLVMNFSGKIDYLEQSTNGTWSLSAADPLVMNFVLCFGLCQLRIRVTIVMLTIFVENLVAVI